MTVDLPAKALNGDPPKLSDLHKCTICGGKVKTRCGKCKEVYYCGAACQQTDWHLHGLLCQSLKNFTTPPDPDSRRAILFRKDSLIPEFIWIRAPDGEFGCHLEVAQAKNIVGAQAEVQFIWENPVRGRTLLANGVILLYRLPTLGVQSVDQANKLGKATNKSLFTLLSKGATWLQDDIVPIMENGLPIFGDVLIMAADLLGTNDTRDVTLQDLRNAIDFISCHTVTSQKSASHEYQTLPLSFRVSKSLRNGFFDATKIKRLHAKSRNQTVIGVRVTAMGDGDLTFRSVSVPRDHPFLLETASRLPTKVLHTESKFDVPSKVQLPLAWIRHPNSSLDGKSSGRPLRQDVANTRDCLLAELSVEFQKAGDQHDMDFSFFRCDFKNLATEHMEALCGFCLAVLPHLKCQTQKGSKLVPSKIDFERYFKICKADNGWREDVVSPYLARSAGKAKGSILKWDCSCNNRSSPCCHSVWSANQLRHLIGPGASISVYTQEEGSNTVEAKGTFEGTYGTF